MSLLESLLITGGAPDLADGFELILRPVIPDLPKAAISGLLEDDGWSMIALFLSRDNLLAFSLTCRRFNTIRKRHVLGLRTSLAWTLSRPTVTKWALSLGCPSPFPYWAELQGFQNALQHLNGLIVKVMGRSDRKGQQPVRLNSSLSSQAMKHSPPPRRVDALEGTVERYDMDDDLRMVSSKNLRVLQPYEIARAKVLFFHYEILKPGHRVRLDDKAALFVRVARDLNPGGEGQLGELYCSKAVLGIVGGETSIFCGAICPKMSGVEVIVDSGDANVDKSAYTLSREGQSSLEIVGGRPFEILELLHEDYVGHPSIRDTLLGRARIFHARVRWIPPVQRKKVNRVRFVV